MTGSDILGHLHNIRRVEVDEINTIFDRGSIKIARDKLKEEGYSVLEEGRYERIADMNTNKVLPKQNINDFKVEKNQITYYYIHLVNVMNLVLQILLKLGMLIIIRKKVIAMVISIIILLLNLV